MQLMDDVIVDVRESGGEDIDGVSTTRYEASLNGEEAQRVFEDYMDEYMTEMEKCGLSDTSTTDDIDEMLDDIDTMVDAAVDLVTIEAWIDEDGYLLQQRVTIELDEEDLQQLIEAIEPESVEGFEEDITYLDLRMEVTTTNSRIGEDIDIDRPEDAVSFMELFEDLEDSFGGGSGTDSFTG
jgi:polyhydroxyalkanoate synthesis regulator phasin